MKDFIKSLAILFFILIASVGSSDAQYSFMLKWGICGANDGEFNSAYDVACDLSGFVYVSDRYNHRIQKFTPTGAFRLKWGNLGTDNGEFDTPQGITVDFENRIEVADLENNRIQRFTALGGYLLKFASSGPADVAVDNAGNYFVTDYGLCTVTKYNPTGIEITHWGGWGSANGLFHNPDGIVVDSANNVYVVDQNNNRIQKFNNNGSFIKKWGISGSGAGQFNAPVGIAVDKFCHIFVADNGNNRIQKFDSAGNYITQWGLLGSEDGKFDGPTGVAVDTSGNVYVADYNNCRVQKFQWKNLNITTVPFSGTFCRGAGLNVSYTVNDQFNTSNTFIAQLSNETGSFVNPTEIGRIKSRESGIISSAIPSSINSGTGYRIRVIGTDPYVEGTNNGSDITINPGPNPVFSEKDTNVCEDVPGNVYTTGNYNSYQWTYTGTQGYDYIVTAGGTTSSNSSTVTWLTSGTRYVRVEVTDSQGCKGIVTSTVNVKEKPLFNFNSSTTITCANNPIEFSTESIYPNYAWTFSGVENVDYIINGGNSSTMSSTTVTWISPGEQIAQLEVTSEIGCKNSKSIKVQINPMPQPVFSEKDTNTCSGVPGIVYSITPQFTNYNWTFSGAAGTDYLIEAGGSLSDNSTTLTWLKPGNKYVKVKVTNDYNCINEIQSDVVVKPGPNPVFENPRASLCIGEDWNINTTATFTSYLWTIPGTEGIDYLKISGGTENDNSVIIRWLFAGLRTVKLQVTSENGCSREISIEVNVYRKPTPVIYGEFSPCQFVTEFYTTESDVGMVPDWTVIGGKIVRRNGDSLFVKWETDTQGMLKLVQNSIHGCKDSMTKIINVKQMPDVTLQNFPDACINDSSFILSGGLPVGGVYSGDGVVNGIFIPSVAGLGTHEISYTYLHNNGCVNLAKQNLKVNPQPQKPSIQRIGNTLASSSPTGNQWFFNGTKMIGKTSQFLNIESIGFYQVQVIDFNGCISELSDMFEVESSGINELVDNFSFDIFPNPIENNINIIIRANANSMCELKLVDLLGELLTQSQLNLSDGVNNIKMDTHLLNAGTYFLITEINGKFYNFKLIKY